MLVASNTLWQASAEASGNWNHLPHAHILCPFAVTPPIFGKGRRRTQAMTGHLIPAEVMEQAMLEVISRHVKDKQFLTSPFRLHRWQQHLVCLNLSPQQLQGLGYKNRCAKKPHQPSNQHQTSFLLFKLDLAPKSCWGDCLFLKAQPDQCSTSKRTASCLSTESAWSRSLACYKTEPGSWLMPKEQQLEYLLH